MTMETDASVPGDQPNASPAGMRLRNVSELRLLFAASVVLSHAAALLGKDGYITLRTVLNSEAAVQGFFVLSGYLVCGSYERIGSPFEFYKRRLLRIYPGYFVAVVLLIALAVAQATWLGANVQLTDIGKYLAANLITLNFLAPSVPGVFANNPVDTINGALWSIKVELMFYAALPLFVMLARRTSFTAIAIVMIAIGAIWWPALQFLTGHFGLPLPLSFKFQLPGQLHYFGLGVALYARSRRLITTMEMTSIAIASVILLAVLGEPLEAIHALVLVLLVGGLSALPQAPDVFRGNDISFGIYLCHFPIIQMFLAAGLGALPFGLYLAAVVVTVVGYGFISWHLIERRALAWQMSAPR